MLKKYQNHLPENHETGAAGVKRATFGKGGTLSSVTGGGGGDAVDHQRRNQESHSFEQFLGKLEERLDEIDGVPPPKRQKSDSDDDMEIPPLPAELIALAGDLMAFGRDESLECVSTLTKAEKCCLTFWEHWWSK